MIKMVKPIMVVQGYHFGYKKNGKTHLWINTTKQYNFKVTKKTHRIAQCKKLKSCSVWTKRGKQYLVITNIIRAKGPVAIKMARKLKPVIAFHNYGMRNPFLYMLLFNNTKTQGNKQKHVLNEFKAVTKRLRSHKTNQDIMHDVINVQKVLTDTYGKPSPKANEISSDKMILKGDKLRHELKRRLEHLSMYVKHPTVSVKKDFQKKIDKVQPNDMYLWLTQSNTFHLANAKDLKAKLNGLTVDIKHGWRVHDINAIGNQNVAK